MKGDALNDEVRRGDLALIRIPAPAARDEIQHGASVRGAGAKQIEIAVARGREGRGGVVRRVAERFLQEGRLQHAGPLIVGALRAIGQEGFSLPARRKKGARAEGGAQASRPPGPPRCADILAEGIGDAVGGGPCRRHEVRIGGRHRRDGGGRQAFRLEVTLAEPQVAGELEGLAERLAGVDIGGVAIELRYQRSPDAGVAVVLLTRREVRRRGGDTAASRPDGVGHDIAAAGAVEAHEVARCAVIGPMVGPAERPQIAGRRIGAVQGAQGVLALELVGRENLSVRPCAPPGVRRDDGFRAAFGRADP